MKKTFIYLIRHGESVGNRENRIRGRFDFPLNENGLAQANALASVMRDKKIEYVYTSPLKRALTTAEIISNNCKCPLYVDDSFCNIKLGPWEGRLKSEIAASEPQLWKTWINDPESLFFEGAETLDEVMDRSLKGMEQLIERHRGKTFAVVSHRGVLKPMLSGALGIQKPRFWRLHIDTGSYSLLTHDDSHGFCLMGLNFTEHLQGIPLVQEFE
ncbi:MAG: histidine phosphatase family protein [Synergistaceae bacterium]|nr:histidine phosphatase family protein [Synergistaceae bacterium]